MLVVHLVSGQLDSIKTFGPFANIATDNIATASSIIGN